MHVYAADSPVNFVDPEGLLTGWDVLEMVGTSVEYIGYATMALGGGVEAGGGAIMVGGATVASTGAGAAPGSATVVAGGGVVVSGWAIAVLGAAASAYGLMLQSSAQNGRNNSSSSSSGGGGDCPDIPGHPNPRESARKAADYVDSHLTIKPYHLPNGSVPGKSKFWTNNVKEIRKLITEGLEVKWER